MSKNKAPDDKPKKGRKQLTGDYKVGYCRTPENTRWKPNCPSPNPSGRPKKRKGPDEIFFDIMHREHVYTENGEKKSATCLQIVVQQLAQLAMRGDLKALKEYLARADRSDRIVGAQFRNPVDDLLGTTYSDDKDEQETREAKSPENAALFDWKDFVLILEEEAKRQKKSIKELIDFWESEDA